MRRTDLGELPAPVEIWRGLGWRDRSYRFRPGRLGDAAIAGLRRRRKPPLGGRGGELLRHDRDGGALDYRRALGSERQRDRLTLRGAPARLTQNGLDGQRVSIA